ncbi:MAG: molybdopterin-dependent oxidoreductase, partial [Gammaproteobacteria bacterium]
LLPHREAGGGRRGKPGLDAAAMLAQPLRAYLMLGLEPELDTTAGAQVLEVLAEARFVACVTPFASEAMRSYAHVLLPMGTFAETSGSYVNGEGRWQSFDGVARPLGESRPAWKILRVLGNLAGMDGFDYDDSVAIRDELLAMVGRPEPAGTKPELDRELPAGAAERVLDYVPMYAIDPLVRRSAPLQATTEGQTARRRDSS